MEKNISKLIIRKKIWQGNLISGQSSLKTNIFIYYWFR